MGKHKQQWLLYIIAATIVTIIATQLYWNYKNYQENKRQITNEIQLSLDNAVEEYFSSVAKNNVFTIVKTDQKNTTKFAFKNNVNKKNKVKLNSITIKPDSSLKTEDKNKMLTNLKNFALNFNNPDSDTTKNRTPDPTKRIFKGKKAADSLKTLTFLEPIIISFFDDSIIYDKVDSLIQNQLSQKNINITHSFNHLKKDSVSYQSRDSLLNPAFFTATAKSTFVKDDETWLLKYNAPNFIALKRSFVGISFSLVLLLAVIAALFYLLTIINKQKELAAIKNDLISNITHEFKTPIATVSTAIEAIENFNVLDDKEKTKKYLSISSIHLKKLNQMVEKLLETATLDSEQLILKKEQIDVVEIIQKQVNKHQLLCKAKEITFSTNLNPIYLNVDVFHFENTISNLIDNAIKYGGNSIKINVNSIANNTEITVTDNGQCIDKIQQEKIFDKFYRVPKGNTHDVKGFGIGLYYTKKIIEKHGGTITLIAAKNNTVFKITL